MTGTDRSDLSDLAAFVAVARAGGFRNAARRNSCSPSALSEAMRRLETRLNMRLFNRTTRSVTLTEAGRGLLDRLSPALSDIGAALDSLDDYRGEARGTLRLNVPSVAADLVLPPILAEFIALHPNIRVEVAADEHFIDVLAAGFDAGIRYDDAIEKDMIAVPIGPREQRFVTAASKAYLKAHGVPGHPRELLAHACIRHRFLSGHMPAWEFVRGKQNVKISPNGPLIANRVGLQIEAARAGLGIVHAFDGFLAPALAARALVPILENWSERFTGPYLYFAGRRHMPGPLRAFVDFVKRSARRRQA
jgi:DNA-binding transcriptional LysR family regulator